MVKYFVKSKMRNSNVVVYTPFNKKSTATRDAKLTKKNEGNNISVRVVDATDYLKKNLIKSKVGNYYLRK